MLNSYKIFSYKTLTTSAMLQSGAYKYFVALAYLVSLAVLPSSYN
ncbi:hypothetical protein HMPREF1582_01242 [Gardnerella vaginalis JCP8151A]|nr:hypothetical protein HMPREF1582_01242 [Gardnerella vaginalis JCP8151A]